MDNKNNFIKFLLKNNKKIIFIIIGCFGIFYIYKKFLGDKIKMLRDIYKNISEYNELFKGSSSFTSISKTYESSFENLASKLLNKIKEKVDKDYPLEDLFERFKNAPKEHKTKLWVIIKNKTFLSFYCSIVITRFLLLLAQTHLLLLERINIDQEKVLSKEVYRDLITELWITAQDYIDFLFKKIENVLNPIVEQILINDQVSFNSTVQLIEKLRSSFEEIEICEETRTIQMKVFSEYLNVIEMKIKFLENSKYTHDINAVKINSFLKYYQTYFDVIRSNLFQTILIKGLDHDFDIIYQLIELNFEDEKKKRLNNNNHEEVKLTITKLVPIIMKISQQVLDKDKSIFTVKSFRNPQFTNDLNEYFRIIYD